MNAIQKLRDLEVLATPAPWETRFLFRATRSARQDPDLFFHGIGTKDWSDAALTATLRNLAPEILAVLEAVEEERATLAKKDGWLESSAHNAIRAFHARAAEVLG